MKVKELIMDTLSTKLKDTGILKVVLVFNLLDETYNIMLKLENTSVNDTQLSASEMNTIKKLFIRRLVDHWNSKYSDEPTSVIIDIDLVKKELNTYVKTKKSKDSVIKFDYV